MAHLARCGVCGRQFRCEALDHPRPAWWWCSFQCPDRTLHGFSLYQTMDAEFLQFIDRVTEFETEKETIPGPGPRSRSLRCRAQGQREHGGS